MLYIYIACGSLSYSLTLVALIAALLLLLYFLDGRTITTYCCCCCSLSDQSESPIAVVVHLFFRLRLEHVLRGRSVSIDDSVSTRRKLFVARLGVEPVTIGVQREYACDPHNHGAAVVPSATTYISP